MIARQWPLLLLACVRMLQPAANSAFRSTAIGGTKPACVHLTTLASPETIGDYMRIQSESGSSPVTEATATQPTFNYVSDISTLLRSSIQGTTFWSSSARSLISRSDFALGTSSGTILVASTESSWTFERTITFHQEHTSGNVPNAEVLAVDWLSHHTILNGCRDGHIRLWDIRSRAPESTSCPLKHPSSIAHARTVNENKIVVTGIENQLCTYDLRFLTLTYARSGASTRPYLSFPTYRNRDLNGLAVGFDVRRDLIAAGTDEGRVQVFDGCTGQELQMGTGVGLGERKLGGSARCLRLVGDEDGEGEVRLFVAAGESVEEWAW